jgi:hypothetical protein
MAQYIVIHKWGDGHITTMPDLFTDRASAQFHAEQLTKTEALIREARQNDADAKLFEDEYYVARISSGLRVLETRLVEKLFELRRQEEE